MISTKTFPLRVVLSASTGRLLTKGSDGDNGIGDLYEILNWMTNDNLFTHQLPRAFQECKPWLLRWFPELQAAEDAVPILQDDIQREGADIGIELWLGKLELVGLQKEYAVPRIPRDDHEYKNPYDELVEMRGTDEGIIIVNKP